MSSSHGSSVCDLTEYWCNTEMKVHPVKYVWTIDNFDFHEAQGSDLYSPSFSSVSNNQVKWCLYLKPNGRTDAKDTVSIYICLSSDGDRPLDDETSMKIYLKCSFAALNGQQNKIGYTGDIDDAEICVFTYSGSTAKEWGENVFLKKTDDFRNNVLSNNKLTITCTMIFSLVHNALSNTVRRCTTAPLYPDVLACDIIEDFRMLLENHDFADVVICVKGKEYPAHKNILAARSSVFAAMFKHNFKENETNRIEIKDMNEEVVAEMLRFIYTGKCENAEKFAAGLLAAADKYDLNRLKMICAEALYKTISVDNAANILTLAKLHCAKELKSKTIKFMVARFPEVVNSTTWQIVLMLNPLLIHEVCQTLGSRLTSSNDEK